MMNYSLYSKLRRRLRHSSLKLIYHQAASHLSIRSVMDSLAFLTDQGNILIIVEGCMATSQGTTQTQLIGTFRPLGCLKVDASEEAANMLTANKTPFMFIFKQQLPNEEGQSQLEEVDLQANS
jgi:hypothetical protein